MEQCSPSLDQFSDRTRLVRLNGSSPENSALDAYIASRHAWMSYSVDLPPTKDPLLQRQVRAWEPKTHEPNMTMGQRAYKPYSTYVMAPVSDCAVSERQLTPC